MSKELADHFGERLEKMTNPQPKTDLRVTISWNTDATDVDLWVIEPDGTKCFYQNRKTPNGGELSEDQTQGYGPERYQMPRSQGVYKILVHYFRRQPQPARRRDARASDRDPLCRHAAGSDRRHTVILKQHNQQVEVCQVKF